MTVPVDDVSVLDVLGTPDVDALSTVVSQVARFASVESDSLVDFSSPWSHDDSDSGSVSLSLLVGDGELSLLVSSDGSGSSVEDKPLLFLTWPVVSDSKSELVATDVLVPEEGSVTCHS